MGGLVELDAAQEGDEFLVGEGFGALGFEAVREVRAQQSCPLPDGELARAVGCRSFD